MLLGIVGEFFKTLGNLLACEKKSPEKDVLNILKLFLNSCKAWIENNVFAPEMFTRNHDNIKAIKLVFESDRNKNSSLWNSIIYMESFDEVGDFFPPTSLEDKLLGTMKRDINNDSFAVRILLWTLLTYLVADPF